MSQRVAGDLNVSRNITARSVQEALSSITIAGSYTITTSDPKILNFLGTAGNNTVVLPDATSIPTGWQVEIINNVSSTVNVNVMDSASHLVQSIGPNQYYIFTSSSNVSVGGQWISTFQVPGTGNLSAPVYFAGVGGVSQGDVVYTSDNNTMSPFSNLTSDDTPIGVAFSAGTVGSSIQLVTDGQQAGGYSGLTEGVTYYWDGNTPSATQSTSSNSKVVQIGVAKNANTILVALKIIKTNF